MKRFLQIVILLVGLGCCMTSAAQDGNLSFSPDGKGFFHFNTGALKGFVRADGKTQGMNSLIDKESGQEIAHGGDYPGLFSLYRVFSKGKRYGDAVRDWPVEAEVLKDGGLQLHWSANGENPFDIEAAYHWRSERIMDFELTVIPKTAMQDFEVFLSSYFNPQYKSWVYTRSTIHNGGEPQFTAADANPLLQGTYLAFPRDRQAAQLIFDGRWEIGHNPVDFAVPRFFALPIGMREDPVSGLAAAIMARPEECFAVETPYNLEPPDGVAGHASLYFSFFGANAEPEKALNARARLMIGKNLETADILKEYETIK